MVVFLFVSTYRGSFHSQYTMLNIVNMDFYASQRRGSFFISSHTNVLITAATAYARVYYRYRVCTSYHSVCTLYCSYRIRACYFCYRVRTSCFCYRVRRRYFCHRVRTSYFCYRVRTNYFFFLLYFLKVVWYLCWLAGWLAGCILVYDAIIWSWIWSPPPTIFPWLLHDGPS